MANIFNVRASLSTITKKCFSVPEVIFIIENSHDNSALEKANKEFGINSITADDIKTYKLLYC